ncbi:hypothetical protein G5V58_06575 [Nocardioides anomalus]|uniref:Uncharacterized protein n=1 Tax=Nocardioides anomalus TaxID=2712223 RepID=A0A6G6WAW0_9ACTN|nr:hypothetical protein [Nocardioides anomalus]QIG42481.1 hypothetical protein G5V58_06575 [Nocardioides anomalus]
MSAENTTQLVLVLLAAALLFAALGWLRNGEAVGPPLAVVALAAAAVVAATADDLAAGRWAATVLVALCGALAVAGGGPLTTRVFTIVDRQDSARQSIDQAAAVLRGGAWIGGLERLAVFAGLAAGFPEGVAVVLALKGVGRFPDLRKEDGGGAATERFIIGTFTSVLWAAGCAGMVALVLR